MKTPILKTPITGRFLCISRLVGPPALRPDYARDDARIARHYGTAAEDVAKFRDLNPLGYASLLARTVAAEERPDAWPPAPPSGLSAFAERTRLTFARPEIRLGLLALAALYLGMSWIDGSLLP